MVMRNDAIMIASYKEKRRQKQGWGMRLLMAVLISQFSFLISSAQTLSGRAPGQVAVGEQFRLSYTVNTDDAKGFRAGNIPTDAFDVLMGPSTSTQSSYQLVNGHMSSSSSITYTYILSAKKQGSFTIPAAHVTVDGKTVNSNEVHIRVQGEARGGQQGGRQQQQQSGNGEVRAAGTAISGSDLFIKVTASKQHVREQEPILLTYKVYTLVGLTQLNGKMADLKSFYTREVPLPQEKQFHIENVNGKPYRTVTWQQYVMFPQVTGKLEVPSLTYEGIVVQQNRNIDPFEAFFNGGSGYIEVKKQIKAPGVTIQVDPLPERPANFSGGVGRYNISASLDQTAVKANDPVRLRVVVSGVGNMKLLKEPEVKFPKDFDHYDAKVTDQTKLTTQGLEGSIVYDFLAVPRHQGSFEIPAIEYTYFDTQAGQYKTVRTEPFKLDVAKGDGNSTATYTGQEDIRQLNSDIHHIKTGETRQHAVGDFFFASTFYWVTLAVLLLAFVSLFIIFRQRAIERADLMKQRAGKANKVATKRLKKAARLMKESRQGEFYDEVLRALWGYVGDKLSMPVEQLSRENISQQLQQHNVSDETIQQFLGALDECEFARYAPGDATGNMNKVYDMALTAITQIATTMKRKKQDATGKTSGNSHLHMLMLLSLSIASSLMTLTAQAQGITKAEADSAYVEEHYQKAARDYETLLKQGVSADLYYNLGNCYYRMDSITQAVIAYERALLLAPGDEDIRFNLQMARSKTIDKITPESEMFFVTWYRALVNMQSVDAWARLALISLAIAIVLALAYLFADRIWLRKVGFFGAVALLLVFVLSNVFAWQQKQGLDHRSGAVIIRSAVNVKSTPSKNGTDLFILHEGTRVTIIDSTMKGWKEIRVDDGKQGWLETTEIEII